MYKRILVPVDGSEPSSRALDEAIRLAAGADARLRIVTVFDELSYVTSYEYQEYGGNLVDRARKHAATLVADAAQAAARSGVDAETHVAEASARRLGEAVADEARDWRADLVVVGSHGRRGVARTLLGSGAEQIVRLAKVPVLVVR